MILTSSLPTTSWGDVFGDQVVASAMIDGIFHHAKVVTLKGSSYRPKRAQTDSLLDKTERGSLFKPTNPFDKG